MLSSFFHELLQQEVIEYKKKRFSIFVENERIMSLNGFTWNGLTDDIKSIIQECFIEHHQYKFVQNVKMLDLRWNTSFRTDGMKWLIPIITNRPCYIQVLNITQCGLCDDDIVLMLNAFDKVYFKQQSNINVIIPYFANKTNNKFIPKEIIELIKLYCHLYESNIKQIDIKITPNITDKIMKRFFKSIKLYFPYLKSLNFRENKNMTDNVCQIVKDFFIQNPYHSLKFINFFGKHYLLSSVTSNGLILLNEMFIHNINIGVWTKQKPKMTLLIGEVVLINKEHATLEFDERIHFTLHDAQNEQWISNQLTHTNSETLHRSQLFGSACITSWRCRGGLQDKGFAQTLLWDW
eukprot:11667_1